MSQLRISVNGHAVEAIVEPRTNLSDFLRDHLRLTGTHVGCEHGVCGACTVLIDEQPARSCIAFAIACDDHKVRTIEDFQDDQIMADLREAFSREHALQCGFCTPAMLIAARDLVLRLPEADDHRIRVEMSGNLCRCTGYRGIVRAIRRVLEARRAFVTTGHVVAPPTVTATLPYVGFELPDPVPEPVQVSVRSPSSRIEEAFLVRHPLDVVWKLFGEMPAVAACLPGAEIIEQTPTSVRGKIRVKVGPMLALFEGAAVLEREDDTRTGTIRGGGIDSLSGSRARGDIKYQLFQIENGHTKVTVGIDYSLQGALAQFSRTGLVNALVRGLLSEFASNLNSRLVGSKGNSKSAVDANKMFLKWFWLRVKAQFAFWRR